MKENKMAEPRKSRNDLFEEWGGWLIVIGLGIEIVLAAFLHPEQAWYEKWALVFATALIAVGVYVEIRFGGNAKAEANARAAEAEARVAEANLELEKLKKRFEAREVTPDMKERLRALQGSVAEIAVSWVRNSEPALFGWRMAETLAELKILVLRPPSPVGTVAAGTVVCFPDGMDEYRKRALAEIFDSVGIRRGSARPWDIGPEHNDAVVIFVGDRLPVYESAGHA